MSPIEQDSEVQCTQGAKGQRREETVSEVLNCPIFIVDHVYVPLVCLESQNIMVQA